MWIPYSIFYRTIGLILLIFAQIVVPEVAGSHTSKEHEKFKMTQDNGIVSLKVPDPEPVVENANNLLEKESVRNVPNSIEEQAENLRR